MRRTMIISFSTLFKDISIFASRSASLSTWNRGSVFWWIWDKVNLMSHWAEWADSRLLSWGGGSVVLSHSLTTEDKSLLQNRKGPNRGQQSGRGSNLWQSHLLLFISLRFFFFVSDPSWFKALKRHFKVDLDPAERELKDDERKPRTDLLRE